MKRIECQYTGIGGKYLINTAYSNITDRNLIKHILDEIISSQSLECLCDIEEDFYLINIFSSRGKYVAGIAGEKGDKSIRVSFFGANKSAERFINSCVVPQFKRVYEDLGYDVDLRPRHHSMFEPVTDDWTKLEIGRGYLWY